MASLQAHIKTLDEKTNVWKKRHNTALVFPSMVERPIIFMMQAWAEYATDYERRFSTPEDISKLGENQILGSAWIDIGKSLRKMLNGELGRLDAGTLDAYVINTMREHGVNTEGL